ncbi:hypothetical protein C0Q70_04039 [Pomacea canaliculata]|uniref:Uncharacterized protein n=1 Tax=Pomacea canaliculata TaxID=400727 RepID=A0A2T7PUD9_POMCA|nr:hypothetical protein C0Q70_04039 [Pomacea canaliculata]
MTYVAQTWCGARRMRKCVRTHKLPLLCCLFGFFWCSLAVLMICQYMRMALSETRQHGKVTGHRNHSFDEGHPETGNGFCSPLPVVCYTV